MRIIPITKFKRERGIEEITEVTFLDTESCDLIVEASNNNIDTIKNWFDIIGIKYTDISLSFRDYGFKATKHSLRAI